MKTIIDLRKNNYFSKIELESISKDDFVNILNDIPLKYINYMEKNYLYYLEYAFPLCDKILDDYILYTENINTFKISNKDNDLGQSFEFIFKISLRIFDIFQIDGYIECDNIIFLNLGENYKYIDKNYFLNKKNILFTTTNQNTKSFDFCIYKPEQKVLILLQAKYIINNTSIQNIDFFKKDVEKVKDNFKKKFKIDINNIFFYM